MATDTTQNPFMPENGESPPFLAGRQEAQRTLQNTLLYLQAGESGGDIIISGASGTGKTALLNWAETEFEKKDKSSKTVRVSRVTPKELTSKKDIMGHFFKNSWKKYFQPSYLYRDFNNGSTTQEEHLGFDYEMKEILIAECRRSPLAVLIDDADGMDAKLSCNLLNVSQQVRSEAPFLMIFAGSHELHYELIRSGAGFIERGTTISIDRLDDVAVKDAIYYPLRDSGIGIDMHTRNHVVAHSEGYPYFVQLWGEALWEMSRVDRHTLTMKDVAQAEKSVDLMKDRFYQECTKLLEDLDLLLPAAIVASAFQNTENIKRDQLEEIVADGLMKDTRSRPMHPKLRAKEAIDGLVHHSVVFCWTPYDLYEPVLPSMLQHILTLQGARIE